MFIKTSLRATLLAAAALATATTAIAQEISYTPSAIANVSPHPFFPLSQINDGITADLPPTYNGFITRTSNPTLGFDLGGAYNVSGMKIWNDVNVREEGIKSFTMRFYDANDTLVTTYSGDGPINGQVEEDDYVFVAENVTRVEMDMVAKDAFGIEVREIKFFGSAVGAPTLYDYACTALTDHDAVTYPERVRYEDALGQAVKALRGQPVSICLPSNINTRTIAVKPIKDFLICYEVTEDATTKSNRPTGRSYPITNEFEDNVIETGLTQTVCVQSTPNRP